MFCSFRQHRDEELGNKKFFIGFQVRRRYFPATTYRLGIRSGRFLYSDQACLHPRRTANTAFGGAPPSEYRSFPYARPEKKMSHRFSLDDPLILECGFANLVIW